MNQSDGFGFRFRRVALIVVICVLALCGMLVLSVGPAQTHGSPIIDGFFTGDWCAPNFIPVPAAVGPDSLTVLSPPACALGVEFLWDDWDALNYGIPDTMGWLLGGGPPPLGPVPDPEVDINFFATTADPMNVFFAIEITGILTPYHSLPHVQIAIDVDGIASGNNMGYDPTGALLLPMGLFALPTPVAPDYLITSDIPNGLVYVWEATTAPPNWTQVPGSPFPSIGFSGPVPTIIEIAVPWGAFAPGPAIGLGMPLTMTLMSAHSAALPPGVPDAPGTAQDDIFTESGAGFTTSPDVVPPSPPSTFMELFIGPGGGAGSQDAFIVITYPFPPTITPSPTDTPTESPTPSETPTSTNTPTETPTPTNTHTPTATDTPSLTPSSTATDTPTPTTSSTVTPTSTPTGSATPTPSLTPTGSTVTPTATATATATGEPPDYFIYLPIMVRAP